MRWLTLRLASLAQGKPHDELTVEGMSFDELMHVQEILTMIVERNSLV